MNRENSQTLLNDFPKLFSELCWGVECGDGWYPLIYELSKEITTIINRDELDIAATQVKEKFGGLRFYMSSTTDEIEKLIDKAEGESTSICECCGKPGKLKSENYWYSTRCEECE